VAAITSSTGDRIFPTEVLLAKGEAGLSVESVVLLNQVRSIDKERLIRRFGAVRRQTLQRADRALAVSLGLVPI
jgi:mRNA interferase MazF